MKILVDQQACREPATGVLAADKSVALARGRRLVAAGTPWGPEMTIGLESS